MGERENALYQSWRDYRIEDADLVRDLWSAENDQEAIADRFYTELDFGTAGLRGVMGAGTNRMNIYVVRRATQGLAEWMLERCDAPEAAIGYDTRHKSELFAREAARVLAGNGIKTHIFREPKPIPMISYAVRKLGCGAGVMITASHNPAEYNGYKTFGPEGCQMGPGDAEAVFLRIKEKDTLTGAKLIDFQKGVEEGMIEFIPESFEDRYLRRVLRESINPDLHDQADLKIVYTPLNGTGSEPVRKILKMSGIDDVTVVPEQEGPDGDFPTCSYPNPETEQALALGLALAKEKKADLLLATDPDCDRVGVAVNHRGELRRLTGNQVGVLLLDYIAKCRLDNGTMPEAPVAVRSLVSTKLADAVAAAYGVEMRVVQTGFRFIGEVIKELDEAGGEPYIFGFEESCGYLSGGYVRDKDGVNASMLICEMAAYYKRLGKTLVDALEVLCRKFGYYADRQAGESFAGEAGLDRIKQMMASLRRDAPGELAGRRVAEAVDYMPESNVLEYKLEDGASVVVRPSGTEPKIKFYYSAKADSQEAAERAVDEISASVKALMGI